MGADERQALRDKLMQLMLERTEFAAHEIGDNPAENYLASQMMSSMVVSGDLQAFYYTSGTRYRWIN